MLQASCLLPREPPENPRGFGVTVTKPVSFRVQRLRKVLEPKNVAASCPEPPFILREPQDEPRVEGDDTGIVALTVTERLYFLHSAELTRWSFLSDPSIRHDDAGGLR